MIERIPKLPLSALLFYVSIVILWQVGLIPSPAGILDILEGLYRTYGLPGLFAASFLEGIVYFGLYFPGSFVVALAVILSDGTFPALMAISGTVALALSVTAVINYSLGRRILANRLNRELLVEEKRIISRGLFLAMLHPNALAFYFFNAGIQKHKFWKVLLVPVILIPYGLILGSLIFSAKDSFKKAIESPYIMISYLLVWFVLALLVEVRRKR